MSTETTTQAEDDLTEDIHKFLRLNFPQIALHGGETAVRDVDSETGEVWIQLSGACGGCGISSMTTQAIQQSLPQYNESITTVHVDTV